MTPFLEVARAPSNDALDSSLVERDRVRIAFDIGGGTMDEEEATPLNAGDVTAATRLININARDDSIPVTPPPNRVVNTKYTVRGVESCPFPLQGSAEVQGASKRPLPPRLPPQIINFLPKNLWEQFRSVDPPPAPHHPHLPARSTLTRLASRHAHVPPLLPPAAS